MNQQSSPIEQEAKDWANKTAKEGESIARPMTQSAVHKWVKDAFIAGSQWQTKQVEQPAKNEPTPVKGDGKLTVEFDGPFEVGENRVEVIAMIPAMPGMVCSGETKQEAWKELITSLKVLIAFNSGLNSEQLKELEAAPKGDDVISKEGVRLDVVYWGDLNEDQLVNKIAKAIETNYSISPIPDGFCVRPASQFAAPQAGKWVQDRELLKELISLAEDGLKLHISNACHQEFISEDREVLAKAKKYLEGSTDKNETNG